MFWILIPILVFFNWQSIFTPYVSYWDTYQWFQWFYFFYNEVYFHSHIAQWLPNHAYGLPAEYSQLFGLGPSSYMMMVVGKLLGTKNAYSLFKISALLDQFFLLLGVYLLSKRLFKNKSTIFIVCTSALCSIHWYDDYDFNIHYYYLIPLTLFFLLEFFQEKKSSSFWLSLITLVLSSTCGNTIYPLPMLSIFIGLFAFGLYWTYKPSFRFLLDSKSSWILMIALGVLLLSLFHQLSNFKEFVVTPMRPPGESNSLSTFLTYGGRTGSLRDFLCNSIWGQSCTYYLGLLTFIFLIISLFISRSSLFLVFLAPGLCALWFTFSGLFSASCYYLPGLSLYRHIGYVDGIYKIFLVFCAGFGLEQFWNLDAKARTKWLSLSILLIIFVFDGLGLTQQPLLDTVNNHSLTNLGQPTFTTPIFRVLLGLGSFILVLWGNFSFSSITSKTRWTKLIFIVFLLLDMGSYTYSFAPHLNGFEEENKDILSVHSMTYQEHRSSTPETDRENKILNYRANHYEVTYDMAQFSVCDPNFRRDYIPKSVVKLSESRQNYSFEQYNEIIACNFPKLRLMSDSWKPIDTSIKVLSYTTDDISISTTVSNPQGAWLVYSDTYHPGWKATVNGQPEPTHPIHIAFKCVHLPMGQIQVRLVFDDLAIRCCSYAIAFIAFLFAMFLSLLLLKELFT